MFASDRILALNVGASKLVLAEFRVRSGQAPELTQYGSMELGIEPESETEASAYIVAGIRDLMKAQGIRPGPVLMTLSGQAVFPRFVKLPPVARDKTQQMIQYEAEQNVPFPIGEVVWDYQLVGTAEAGEQNVMIVAVKTDTVTELTDCVLAAGLEPEIVDVAPMALYNCVRYNYPDLTGCAMVLDIGARSTNLVFIERNHIFSRSIPVAGNAITQELAKSLQLDFKQAEGLKRKHAFVALGGVYALTDDETADRVSKVVRNVVTRLHAEVNRSINFYRSQQGGSIPERVLLTGGSAIIPHMDTFFREKLKVPVDFLNPFVNVAVGGKADPDRAAEEFHQLGEVVGLALRRAVRCPIEINLMPPNLARQKTMRRRLPFFGVAAAGVLLALVTWSLCAGQQLALFGRQQAAVGGKAGELDRVQSALKAESQARESARSQAEVLRALVERRSLWSRLLMATQNALLDGMWLTALEPMRDGSGQVVGLRLTGRGYLDKLKQLEERAAAQGNKATATELLRDSLKAQSLFSDDVTIKDEHDSARFPVHEFVLEVMLDRTACYGSNGK